MDSIKAFGESTFGSLKIRNYRLYFIGQGISLCGTWMQTVALGWLVLELTGSGVQLGGILAAQYLPVLVGGLFAGAIVDSFDKRRILYVTQSALALLALVISTLVFTHLIQVWMVYVFAFMLGLASAVDNPARQTFVHEMVGRDYLRNAVTLNSTVANLARAIGPLIGGVLIAGIGIAFCFLANALSFVAVLFVLYLLDARALHVEEPVEKRNRHFLAVLPYVASVPEIKRILITMAVIGMVSYEFQVSLPLMAQRIFMGNATTYAFLLSAMGAGSVIGGLVIASRKKVTSREFVTSALFFGAAMCATAIMPNLILAIVGMLFVGYFSINLTSAGNTIIQLESSPHMRGRVMSLWAMAIFGSTLLGAPLVGYVGEHAGARYALAIGGVAALTIGKYMLGRIDGNGRIFSLFALSHLRRDPDPEYPKI
jgi:MFS family permease